MKKEKTLKKTEKRKKKDQEMVDWVNDYFRKVILPICHISGYKVQTDIDRKGDKNETFSVSVNFPYRSITLTIKRGGIELLKENKFLDIRTILFHEAFHILHWKYKEYAQARYIDAESLRELGEDLADHFSIIVEDLYQKVKDNKSLHPNKKVI